MSATMITKDTLPRKDFSSITQVGLKAINLALAHATALEPRLPGVAADLQVDLDKLGVVVPKAIQSRHDATTATQSQNALIRQGYRRVQGVRAAVKATKAPKEVQKAYGVGQTISPKKLGEVVAALTQIVDRATSSPEEATGFGLTPADVAEMDSFSKSLSAADQTQESKRVAAPLSTKERNITANRVLGTAALIGSTGMRIFADNASVHGAFAELLAATRSTKKKASKAPPAPPANASTAASGSGDEPSSPA